MLAYLIVILWGVEQVALQRSVRASMSDYMVRCLGIAFVGGVVSVIVAASTATIGAVLAGVLAGHGLLTAPMFFLTRERRAKRPDALLFPADRRRLPHL